MIRKAKSVEEEVEKGFEEKFNNILKEAEAEKDKQLMKKSWVQ